MDKHTHDDSFVQPNTTTSSYDVADWLANRSTLDAGPNFNILDTAANIAGAFNKLDNDDHITQIIISDNAPITLTVTKLSADTDALSKLIDANGNPATVTIKDTAAHIGTGFATIGASDQVTSIVVSDNAAVTLTASQVANNQGAVGELINANSTAAHVTVFDTAANIPDLLYILSDFLSTITSIVVSNSAQMTLTAIQAGENAAILAEVVNNNGNPVTFAVADVGFWIGQFLDQLQANSKIVSITDTDNSAINLSIASFTADAGALAKIHNADSSPVSFIVTDTAANIGGGEFDSLNSNSSVTKIIVSDGPGHEVTITAAQAASDSAALGKLFLAGGTGAAHVEVSDTAANISSALDALNGNSHVDKIVISDSNPLTLQAGQAVGDTTALGEISGAYTIHISDSAANISANIDALASNSHVTSVVVLDSQEVTFSVAQVTNDTALIGELQNANNSVVHVIVSDTAAHLVTALDSLNTNTLVNKIIVSDSTANELMISAAQASADGTALSELFKFNGDAATVTVLDTADNIAGALNDLNTNNHVDKIIVSNSASHEVTISVEQLSSDTHALGELFQAGGTFQAHVAVSDSQENISAAFDTLNGNSQVDKIIVNDDGKVRITADQAANDTTALSELVASDGVTPVKVMVLDTAADISATFDALNNNAHVDTIVVSDSGSYEVTINVMSAENDSAALSELFQFDTTTPAHVAVNDTAAAISAAFDALSANGHVNKIFVSDSATSEVTINVAQAAGDTAALSELFQDGSTTPAQVTVSDTAAHISDAFDALTGNSYVNKIVVSDSATHEVTISVDQAVNDTVALSELRTAGGSVASVTVTDSADNISGAFDTLNSTNQINKIIVNDSSTGEVTLTVSQVVGDTTALGELVQADGSTSAHVAVSDTAANISNDLGDLGSDSQVDKITINDSNALALTAGQVVGDTAGFTKISGDYTIHVTDSAADITANLDALESNGHVTSITISDNAEITVSVEQFASDQDLIDDLVNANSSQVHIIVSDTAANIVAGLDTLDGFSVVNKIIVSDSATNEVTVSTTQLADDGSVLAKLFLVNGTTPAHIAVQDTASNITGALDTTLDNSQIDKIIVTDSATHEVTVSSIASIANDAAALAELYKADGTTLANYAVSDTAANIAAALDSLNANGRLDKIVISDGGQNVVHITVAQYNNDATALAELVNPNGFRASVAVADIGANISTIFDLLAHSQQVGAVIVTDSATNELTLSATQVVNDAGVLYYTYQSNGGSLAHVAVSDTAADISSNIDALTSVLGVHGQVDKIIVSDSGANEVTITATQAGADTAVLGELFQSNGVDHALVAVFDTAAAITTNLDALNTNTYLNKIIVNDSSTNEVTITAAQAGADTTALGELYLANGVDHAHVAVSDTAAAITTNLDALSANSHLDKIFVTDGATNDVVVSVSQLTSDATALGELYIAGGTTQAHVTVQDTALAITQVLDTLNSNSQVDKIVVDNARVVTNQEVQVTVAQLTSDAHALGELFNTNGTQAHVTVVDTAVNISAALNALNGNGQVDHITISDNGPINVSATMALSDSIALGELANANGHAITLIVTDAAATISADIDQLNLDGNISSVVIYDNLALTLSATQITSDAAILAKISNGNASGVTIDVVDAAAHISANLDALKANNDIVSITVSDNAPITVNVAQITADAVVLSELVNANASPITLTVLDTVANIRANLASLNQNTEITSIVISNNGALRLTVAQFTADARVLSILHNANGNPYALQISDSAAHISAALDALAQNSHITTITDTDSAAIVLNVAQITNDAAALADIHNANGQPYTLTVNDSAADISAAISTLVGNSHVAKIVISDSATHEVSMSATQLASNTAVLGKLFDADGVTLANVNVSDTAADVSNTLNILEIVHGRIDAITVTDSADNEVTVSVGQLASDADVLAKLFNVGGTTPANITVSDDAGTIGSALGSLNTNTQVNKIVVSSGGEVTVMVAQLSSDAHALSELYAADGVTPAHVTIFDTAADITAALSTLQSDSQVNKIIVSDSDDHEVVVSFAQLTTFATVLGELFVSNTSSPANVTVSDTAATIASNFDALNGDTQVNKIVVNDSGTNEISLTVVQITNDRTAVGELFSANGSTPASIKVSDTADHISAGFDTLATLVNLDRIVITDSNEVVITAAQAEFDTTLLSELYLSNNSTRAHVEVSDTADNISDAIAYLNSHSQIDHIVISDGNALSLTVSELVTDTTALGKIVGSYSVNVTDTAVHIKANLDALNVNPNVTLVTVTDNRDVTVSIAQLTTDANILSVMVDANGNSAALRISDTAANIQANLGNLEADEFNHNIDLIVISDNGPITLSASQLFIDTDALLSLRNANGSTVSLTVSDTAANIQNSLDSIRQYNSFTHTNQVTSIIVTNNAAITVSAEQVHDDAGVLAEIQNRNGSTVSFKVVDTAADISTYLDSLQANSHISSITVSDNAVLNVTLAQLTSDATALSKLHDADSSPYKLNVSGTAANLTAALHTLGLNSHVHELIVTDSGAGHEVAFNVAQLTNDSSFFGEIFNSDGTTLAGLKLVDSATHLQTLSVAQLQGLAAEGFNIIDSSTNKLLLDLSHYEALGTVHLTAADIVTVSDTAANFAGLSASDIAALSANGVDRAVMSGSADFSVAQWNAFGSVAVTNNGSIEIDGTSGQDTITVGKGNYVLSGLGGGDTMTVGAGHDSFVYGASSESTGTNFDTIHGFNALTDTFQLSTAVTGIDHAVTSGMLDAGANFDSELAADLDGHLNADHAILFTATSGSLSGHTFLIVETNGVAGYQNGDLVIDVTGGIHLNGLSIADFTQPT